MLQSLLNAWKLPDLRKRLLFTAFIIAMYRLGSFVPVPGIDLTAVKELVAGRRASSPSSTSSRAARSSGVAVFALGIMPYITASIIFQLLTRRDPAAGGAGQRG